jgi:hypothetical protein
MISDAINFATSHKAALEVAGLWLMREVPVAWGWVKSSLWPRLVSVYPYLRDNGGAIGVVKTFFVGKTNHPEIPDSSTK